MAVGLLGRPEAGGSPADRARPEPAKTVQTGQAPPTRRALWREVLLVTVLLLVYNAGRLVAASRVSGAFDNARRLLDVERLLHLPYEQSLQSVVLALPDLTRLANLYYAGVHFPLTIGVLVWLWLYRPAHYLWARRSLVAATGVGLVIMTVLPTAPPRMLSADGFVDTGLAFGQSVYGAVGQDKLANQFAAMPSLHVGWSLLVAVVLISASRTRWRWLWLLHPVLTLLVVVATGNHFWIDGLVGASLVTAALVLFGRAVRPESGAPVVVRAQPTRPAAGRPAAGRPAVVLPLTMLLSPYGVPAVCSLPRQRRPQPPGPGTAAPG